MSSEQHGHVIPRWQGQKLKARCWCGAITNWRIMVLTSVFNASPRSFDGGQSTDFLGVCKNGSCMFGSCRALKGAIFPPSNCVYTRFDLATRFPNIPSRLVFAAILHHIDSFTPKAPAESCYHVSNVPAWGRPANTMTPRVNCFEHIWQVAPAASRLTSSCCTGPAPLSRSSSA